MKKYEKIFLATTDTVVGIGGPMNEETKKALNEIKKRPLDKHIVVLVSSTTMAKEYFAQYGFGIKASDLADRYWPGAVTLVISPQLALRVPDNILLQNLIEKVGPIYMTSANITGKPPLDFTQACKKFKHLGAYYDFGPGSNKASMIIDVRTERVLRK